jgi:hypothetical protein
MAGAATSPPNRTAQQRVRAQPIRAVILVVHLADRVQPRNVGHLVARVDRLHDAVAVSRRSPTHSPPIE